MSPCTKSKVSLTTNMGSSVEFIFGLNNLPSSPVGSVFKTSPGRSTPRGLTYVSTLRPVFWSVVLDNRRGGGYGLHRPGGRGRNVVKHRVFVLGSGEGKAPGRGENRQRERDHLSGNALGGEHGEA